MSGPNEKTIPYRFRVKYTGFDFTALNGETTTIEPDLVYEFVNACDVLKFVKKAREEDSRQSLSTDRATKDEYLRAVRECSPNQLGTSEDSGNGETDVDSELGEDIGGEDRLPKNGEDNSKTMGSPDGTTGIESIADVELGIDDGRPLSSQYYDPMNPLEDYDVRTILTSSEDPQKEFEDVVHNLPKEGFRSPDFSNDDSKQEETTGDPISLFSGKFNQQISDIVIPSTRFVIQFIRVYRSGAVYYGPLGYNWDHGYNVFLRKLNNGGIAIWTGNLNEDVYLLNPEGNYISPVGTFQKLEHREASILDTERFVLSDKDGIKKIFEIPPGWKHHDRIPLVRIEDIHGNILKLRYDSNDRLEDVSDQAERQINFKYNSKNFIESITDHTGRTWIYSYDIETDDLVAVTTPKSNQYPDGLTVCYEYDRFKNHPSLLHNLTKVIDQSGNVVVQNQYGEDPINEDFNRVVSQFTGKFETKIHSTHLQYVFRDLKYINVPAWRIEVIDPGILYVYTFNYRGDLLEKRFRLILDGTYRIVVERYKYDKRGNLKEHRKPNGLRFSYVYDINNSEQLAQNNLLKVELRFPLTFPLPSKIISIFSYESRFNRIKTIKDEKGNITSFFYDFEEGLGNKGNLIRTEYPTTTLPDGSTQLKKEFFSYNSNGQIIEYTTSLGRMHKFQYSNEGKKKGYLISVASDVTGVNQIEKYDYDQMGNKTSHIDGLGNKTEWIYNELGQVILKKLPKVKNKIDEFRFFYNPQGYLTREEYPRGKFNDEKIKDPFITNNYSYDLLGNLTTSTFGSNTSTPITYKYRTDPMGNVIEKIDPIGRKTLLFFDERGLLFKKKIAVGTEEERIWKFLYTRNGHPSAIIDPDNFRVDFKYDGRDELKQVILPRLTESERTKIDFEINDFGKVTKSTTTGLISTSSSGVLTETRTDYDERGRPIKLHLGNQTRTLTYNSDDQIIEITDQKQNSNNFEYDGLNRLRKKTDSSGNFETRSYDNAGNLHIVENHEVKPNNDGVDVQKTELNYDSRNRLIRISDPINRVTKIEYDSRNFSVKETHQSKLFVEYDYDLRGNIKSAITKNSNSSVSHNFRYDNVDRRISYMDPETAETTYQYDLHDRLTKVAFPNNRHKSFLHDDENQKIIETLPSGTKIIYQYDSDRSLRKIDFESSPDTPNTLPIEFQRDGLGRAIEISQGSNKITRKFDQLQRMVSENFNGKNVKINFANDNSSARITYPDGRIDKLVFDKLGRLSKITLQKKGSANLTGDMALGTDILNYQYSGKDRIIRKILGNGVSTIYEYDSISRLTELNHQNSSATKLAVLNYLHDDENNARVIWAEPKPLSPSRYDYDFVSRLTKATFNIPLAKPLNNFPESIKDVIRDAESLDSTSNENYSLNLSDFRKSFIRNFNGTTFRNTYTSNLMHQITSLVIEEEGQNFVFRYDNDGRCIQDERFQYFYDALGRLVRVEKIGNNEIVLIQEFDPIGRVIRRVENGNTIQQIHFGVNLIQKNKSNDEPLSQYTYGLNVNEVVLKSNGKNFYPLYDATLNQLCITNDSQNVLERYSYTPFGKASIFSPDGLVKLDESSIDATPCFGGHPLLKIGLYDSQARMYNPTHGIFLQPDPNGYFDSPNLYSYVHHNPINFNDPTGQEKQPSNTDETHESTVSQIIRLSNPSYVRTFVEQAFAANSLPGKFVLWSNYPVGEAAARALAEEIGGYTLKDTPYYKWAEKREAYLKTKNNIPSNAETPKSITKKSWGVASSRAARRAAWTGGATTVGYFGKDPKSTIQGTIERPTIARHSAIKGFLGGLGGGLTMYSAYHSDNLAIQAVGMVGGSGEIIGNFIEAAGAAGLDNKLIGIGRNIARYSGIGGAVVSLYSFSNDIENGDFRSATGSGTSFVAGALGVVGATSASAVVASFSVGWEIGSWIYDTFSEEDDPDQWYYEPPPVKKIRYQRGIAIGHYWHQPDPILVKR